MGIANRNPVSTFEANIRGTWALLEACRRSPAVKQIVVASSDKAYGDQEKLPYDEDAPLQGRHPYDVSKSCADLIAQSYAHTYGLPVVVTRCGNFYGGGDLNWNRIVPGTIRSVLRGERPLIRSDGIIGARLLLRRGRGRCLHAAGRASGERPALTGEAFNFSNELQVTVLRPGAAHPPAAGQRPGTGRAQRGQQRDPSPVSERRQGARRLGWAPYFDLETGLRKTIAWYKEFFSRG